MLLVITLMGPALRVFSQNYLQEGMYWKMHNLCLSYDSCYTQDFFYQYVNGDSVVNNITYKRIFQTGSIIPAPGWPQPGAALNCPTGSYDIFFTLLRQDGLQMYQYLEPYGDTLLYDFDLQVGDPYPACLTTSSTEFYVGGIGTVQIGSETRRVFNLIIPSYLTVLPLVEGIGHNNGFIDPILGTTTDSCLTFLSCFNWLGHGTISLTSTSGCYVGIGEQFLFQTSVFPNPVSSSCTIRTDLPGPVLRIEAVDSRGARFPLDFTTGSDGAIETDMSTLASGLYFLSLYNDGPMPATVKVGKE